MTRRKQAPPGRARDFPGAARIQKDVEAVMLALPLQKPPGPAWSSILPSDGSEAIISSLAEKYVDIAPASAALRPAPTRKGVVARLAMIKKQAGDLLDSLEQLDGTTVDALHLAMGRESSIARHVKRDN
jgi:hypothetical protein